ncbi:hypothetical protein BJ138DRAFT_1117554 [Hygrophoropsis aurantiaca]|uniref:Uncharacterized protein n=1 Tax=Hygrophoropsis aurantiaca TaxID=72124 RepID=A0ACB8A007_9AGAM|nr:hypothetical protein BJ138DRAFT_1117554 [Hygrophoropsis aurantiaca]
MSPSRSMESLGGTAICPAVIATAASCDLREGDDPFRLDGLQQLLSPKITQLVLRLEAAQLGHYSNSAISVVGNICPQMRDFTLCRRQHARESEQSISIVSQVVESFQHLRTVRVNAINERAIAHLARLPSLTNVSFALDLSFDTQLLNLGLPAKPFPMLDILTIQAPTLRFVKAFLNLIKISPTLIAIYVAAHCVASRCEASCYAEFFVALSNSCCTKSLKTLIVREPMGLERRPDIFVGVQELQPVFRFTQLQMVMLELVSTFNIDDGALVELGHTWPQLAFLHMNETMGWTTPSKITYQGLLNFLEHCPKLTSLGIDVDFASLEEMPIPSACPCNGLSNKLIKEISLGNSRVNNPVHVALFVSAVLPNLRKVNAWSSLWASRQPTDMLERYRANWETFNQLLPVLAAARTQGKGCFHTTTPIFEQ